MATIITKNSQTASAVPAASSLEVGELAVNTADGKLYTEHTGGVVKEIIPSTVVDGGITAAKIASNAVTTAKIADANVTGVKLENSGVTAGTYTSATVTVDAKGRITSASSGSGGGVTSAVAGNGIAVSGSTGAVTFSVACPTVNTVGSYVFGGGRTIYPTNFAFGSSRSVGGSEGQVGLAAIYNNGDTLAEDMNYSSISGTWRWMGTSFYTGDRRFAIMCRIA